MAEDFGSIDRNNLTELQKILYDKINEDNENLNQVFKKNPKQHFFKIF